MRKKIKVEFLTNCLAVECPELSLDWHPTKNLPLTTTNTSYGSNKKVWWKCRTCAHEWDAYISNRRKQYKYPGQAGTACPNCVGRVQNLTNSFAAFRPEMILEWHPTSNLPFTPYNVPPTSVKKWYWVCKSCEHEWVATAASRSGGAGCPLCGEFKNRDLAPSKEWKSLNQQLILKPKRISHGE